MKFLFFKINLYIFELISTASMLYIIVSFIATSLNISLNAPFRTDNQKDLKIQFNVKLNNDYNLNEFDTLIEITKILDNDNNNNDNNIGYVVINKNKVPDSNDNESIMAFLNENYKLNSCFVFDSSEALDLAKNYISLIKRKTKNSLLIFTYVIAFLFLICLKFNFLAENMYTIFKLKDKNDLLNFVSWKYFFYTVIFNLTVLLILPSFISKSYDLRFNYCLGFDAVYFNSFFYDRKFLEASSAEISKVNIYASSKYDESDVKNYVFLDHTKLDFNDDFYFAFAKNVIFMSVVIWISGVFNIFNQNLFVISKDMKKSQKIKNIVWIVFVILCWGYLLFYGLLDTLDSVIFYHKLVFHETVNLFTLNSLVFLISFYFYVYIYAFLICFFFIFKIKQIKRKVKEKILKNKENNFEIGILDESDISIKSFEEDTTLKQKMKEDI